MNVCGRCMSSVGFGCGSECSSAQWMRPRVCVYGVRRRFFWCALACSPYEWDERASESVGRGWEVENRIVSSEVVLVAGGFGLLTDWQTDCGLFLWRGERSRPQTRRRFHFYSPHHPHARFLLMPITVEEITKTFAWRKNEYKIFEVNWIIADIFKLKNLKST